MATVAALQTSSLSSVRASLASKAFFRSPSDCRNGSHVFASARPFLSLFCSSSTSSAAGLSSSCFFVPSHSVFKIPREAESRARDAARVSGVSTSPRCESEGNTDSKIPFGYKRKDVIGIGVGLVGFGVALKYGLELFGVDSIRAGNAVQLIMVLGLTVGWISTYVFRVSSKEMTYAKQLKDYENKVMEKRLEEMPEAELESMLAQIEEEKRTLRENRDRLL